MVLAKMKPSLGRIKKVMMGKKKKVMMIWG